MIQIDPTTLSDEALVSGQEPEQPASDVQREEPETDEATLALITQWQGRIEKAKGHWDKAFKRMTDDMKFASGDQWLTPESDNYKANIVQRHIQQRVAALYAKNPKAVVKRRKRLDFALWDGSMKQLEVIQMMMQQAIQLGAEMPPGLSEKLADIAQGTQSRMMLEKVAQTLEVIFAYVQDSQFPPHKISLKQLVRRTLVCGFGWGKVGYQRTAGKRPDDVARITGLTEQLAKLERLLADAADHELTEEQAEYAELTLMLEKLKTEPEAIVHEGLVFDFPDSRNIIVDPCCKHLRTFTGAKWVAEEFTLSKQDVIEIYKVDVGSASSDYSREGILESDGKEDRGVVTVWEIYDKTTGQTLTIAKGYKGWLRAPAEPVIKLKRFWPWFGLAFNELEADGDNVSVYPISDVSLIRPMQKEYNRAREGLRRHRVANSPKIATAQGALSETDIDALQSADPLGVTVIQLQGLQPGADPKTLLAPIQMPPIDPAKYDTEMIFADVQRVSGSQEANLGGTAGGTATESSIAESSRMSSMASNVDDLDDFLTELYRACGEMLLREMSPEKAKEIAGQGAVWPDLTAQEIADELSLEVKAGSSGRPNKAAEIANFEKLMPVLIQIPGISPDWLAREAIKRLDDSMDPTDAIIGDIPSIVAMNAMKMQEFTAGQQGGPKGAPGSDDPNAQGPQGANNVQQMPGRPGTDGPNEAGMGGMVA